MESSTQKQDINELMSSSVSIYVWGNKTYLPDNSKPYIKAR